MSIGTKFKYYNTVVKLERLCYLRDFNYKLARQVPVRKKGVQDTEEDFRKWIGSWTCTIEIYRRNMYQDKNRLLWQLNKNNYSTAGHILRITDKPTD